MKLASYNMENLFLRPVAFASGDPAARRAVLEAYQRVSEILGHEAYSDDDKTAIIDGLTVLGLDRDDESAVAWLRQNRGRLVQRGLAEPVTMKVVAAGRSSWIGWLELKTDAVDEKATRHTAQVVGDVNADVIATIEVEGRRALNEFSRDLLTGGDDGGYAHVMAIPGNDNRGINVGVMSRQSYPIITMRTHVDDTDTEGLIFCRDCAEYTFATSAGTTLLLLVCHFKSKGYGAETGEKRRREAGRVAAIYTERRAQGFSHIAVAGDFNDTPDSKPLADLLAGTDLREVSDHPGFDTGAVPGYAGPPLLGTYGSGTPEKIDYILLSPALYDKVVGGGIFRKGVWTSSRNSKWEPYPDLQHLTKAEGQAQAASDHAAIWADLAL
jgi:endonuclease/exonuclease/phosphatase family metal-dependent hydrolase